jgi:hypothetical protein
MQVAVRICPCGGNQEHEEFTKSEHQFPDGTIELLPVLCHDNEFGNSEIYNRYTPILETLESNENWTMFACYSGMIAEVKPGLYFFSFGDTNEVGEENFYIKSDLKSVLELLLSEWGPAAPPWREFLGSLGKQGYPAGYEPGSMVDHKRFFPKLDEDGLTVGVSFNGENPELINLLKGL